MATHSNILAWKIQWTEEPGRLQSMGSQELDMSQLLRLRLIDGPKEKNIMVNMEQDKYAKEKLHNFQVIIKMKKALSFYTRNICNKLDCYNYCYFSK